MPISALYRGKTPRNTAHGSIAPIYVDSDDNRTKVIPAGSGTTEVVLQEASGAGSITTPTAAFALVAADSGKIIMLNAAAGFAITLPAAVAGLRFTFIVGAAFATTPFSVITPGALNIIQGGAIVNSVYVPAVNEDAINFIESAETIGDYVSVVCDGTNWIVYDGTGALAGSITFTT